MAQIVDWPVTKGINEIVAETVYTGENVVFRLEGDNSAAHNGSENCWNIIPEGITVTLDLNGYIWAPTSVSQALFYLYYSGYAAHLEYKNKLNFIIENGTVDFTNNSGRKLLISGALRDGWQLGSTIQFRRAWLNLGTNKLWEGYLNNNCAWSDMYFYGCYIKTAVSTSPTEYAYSDVIFSDCILHNQTEAFWSNDASTNAFRYKRTYSIGNTFTAYSGDTINGLSSSINNAVFEIPGVSFTKDNFYEDQNPLHDLYLVPLPSSALGNASLITQDEFAELEGLNEVGVNGVRSTSGNKVYGPMGSPDIIQKPTDINVARGSETITVTWVNNPDTPGTKTVVSYDKYSSGSFDVVLGEVDLPGNSLTVNIADLPDDGVTWIQLVHA